MAKSPRAADVSPDRDRETEHMELSTGGDADRVAQRAYERYEARGREDGRDQEDWFEAERELQQGASESATAIGGRGSEGGSNSDRG